MLVDVFEAAYLLRYWFAFVSVVVVWLMTKKSVLSLRDDFSYRVRPIPGCSLIGEADFVLPLYHTTCLGSSAACDIRIRNKDIAGRHALIYRYDGDWFVKPVRKRWPVFLNGVQIVLATPLESGDIIDFGGYRVVFNLDSSYSDEVDYNSSNNDSLEPYNEPFSSDILPFDKNNYSSVIIWLFVNLFALSGIWLVYRFIPKPMSELRLLLPGFMLAVLFIVDIYYLLLPLILRGLDRFLFIVLTQLMMLGLFVQLRLSGITGSGVLQAADAVISADNAISSEAAIKLAEYSGLIMDGLKSQGLSLIIGLALMPFAIIIIARTRILEPIAVLCAAVTPALLIATLILGHGSEEYGATLWISVGGMSLQLTEFAKVTYIIVLASFFKTRPSLRIQFLFAGWAAVVFLLLMLLPDLGSVMILLPVTVVVYVVMTSEYLITLGILMSGTAVSLFAYNVFPHVQRRLTGWTTLWQEVSDSNRQIVYGLQAVARGGLLGRGLGNGSPGGIPLVSSDMVFTIVCEELGMIGALALIAMFVIIWLRAARVTVTAADGFTSSLALAAGTMFFCEAVVVMAGATGLIPLTGVTLPFISEGGSSLLAKLILMSILIGLSARKTGTEKL